ncbi:sugar transferase [Candidatus Saccharibacteria bacterium]|nr:sugar transferase [Candidatus Saccharibacteria bacterium]
MYRFIKRLFDILFSLVGIIFLIPTFLLIKIAYICTGDFDRIIYSQTRIGKNGKPFKMYKFRTMVPDADKQLARLMNNPKYRDEWEKYHKINDDPRITKVGHFIRHGSIDELPQIINVLLGQLSIIGPRPLVPGEIEEYKGEKELYESIRPGITGWWAVNGRSNMDSEKRMALEYYYVDNRSLRLDTSIFFRTIGAVFSRRGAK